MTLDGTTVAVETSWSLMKWKDRCKPGTVQQKLWRQVDNGPEEVIWEGKEPASDSNVGRAAVGSDSVLNRVKTSPWEGPPTTYRYIHTASCETPGGRTIHGFPLYSPRFSLYVFEDDLSVHWWAPIFLRYDGNWVMHGASGGDTTHEAKEVGATATLRIDALGVAWVTTVDEKSYPIEARVSSQPQCDISIQRHEACPETVNTGEHDFGEDRVVKWSIGWSNYQQSGVNPRRIGENRPHVVEITSEEDSRVDVDAFVIAYRQ